MSSDSVIISVPVSSLTTDAAIKAVKTPEKTNGGETTSPTAKILTEKEKLELRAKKFGGGGGGGQVDSTKLENRAKRFGESTVNSSSSPNGTDDEKLKKRSERFGAAKLENNSNGNGTVVDPERLKKRTERFGAAVADATATSTDSTTNSADDEKISKRKERFGVVDEESKKKQRSERFNKT